MRRQKSSYKMKEEGLKTEKRKHILIQKKKEVRTEKEKKEKKQQKQDKNN